jgi:hypothetical protein
MARAGKRERARIRQEKLVKTAREFTFARACGGWNGAPPGRMHSASNMLNERRFVGRSSFQNQPWPWRTAQSVRIKNRKGRIISLLPVVTQ